MPEGEPKIENPEEESTSSVFRVVGGNESEQDNLFDQFIHEMKTDKGKDFEYEGVKYNLEDFEREKTEKENILTKAILNKLEYFLGDIGDTEPLKIRPEQIHFLDPEKFKKVNLPLINFFDMSGQYIGIVDSKNDLANAQGIAHEAIHMHSFHSLEIMKGGDYYQERRSGIGMRANKEKAFYFDQINEAVTAETTVYFDRNYISQIPELKEELNKRQKFIEEFIANNNIKATEEIAYIRKNSSTGKDEPVGFTYPAERDKLECLINDIFEKNKNNFQSKDYVFMLFTKAMFAGETLDLARIIEKTYGKGYFRELGKKTAK